MPSNNAEYREEFHHELATIMSARVLDAVTYAVDHSEDGITAAEIPALTIKALPNEGSGNPSNTSAGIIELALNRVFAKAVEKGEALPEEDPDGLTFSGQPATISYEIVGDAHTFFAAAVMYIGWYLVEDMHTSKMPIIRFKNMEDVADRINDVYGHDILR